MTFLEKLKELEEKATEGPWRSYRGKGYAGVYSEGEDVQIWGREKADFTPETFERWRRDADMLVLLRNAAPKLIALLEAFQGHNCAAKSMGSICPCEMCEALAALDEEVS